MSNKTSSRTIPARRFLSLRADCSVASATAEIEQVFGLPKGSVRLQIPSGRRARKDKKIGALLADFRCDLRARAPAGSEPKGDTDNPAPKPVDRPKVDPIPLAEFDYKARFPRPRNIKLVDGAEWPAEDMPGDNIAWQMLATGRYTREQIVATILAHESSEFTPKVAANTIPIVLGWMKKLGIKGSVK
jgi:hypothetical protein